MITFKEAFDRLIDHEGGYVNNPKDPGGETKFGISKRSYPHLNIKDLTLADAEKIYFDDFWMITGAKLDSAVMFQAFDGAVNHGIGNSIRFLQRAIGAADDGRWGPVSQRMYEMTEKNDCLFLYLACRGEFMTKLSTFATFGAGWMRRIFANLRYAAKDN